MAIWRVRSPPDRPLAICAMQDMLSWNVVTTAILYPCKVIHWLAESENPTSSASVLDFVDLQCTAPTSPITTPLPVWERLSVCTPRDRLSQRSRKPFDFRGEAFDVVVFSGYKNRTGEICEVFKLLFLKVNLAKCILSAI